MRQIIGVRHLRRITGVMTLTPEQVTRLNKIAEVAIRIRPEMETPHSWTWHRPTSTLTVLTKHGMMEKSFQ